MDEEQPETEAAAANDDTEVIDSPQAETPRQAWSDAHDDDDDDRLERHSWHAVTGQAAALITAGAAIAIVVAVLGWITLHKERPAAPASPSPSEPRGKPTTPAAAAPQPDTTTNTAPPPTAIPSAPAPATTTTSRNVYERGSQYDRAYLDLMAQEGWGCTDGSDREQCAHQMLSFAHQVCSYTPQSYSFFYQIFGLPPYFGPREMRRAILNASIAYPNCVVTGTP